MLDSFEDSSARLERLRELARHEKDPKTYYEIQAAIKRVLDERQLLRNNAEIIQKSSDATGIEWHESEKQSWPVWKRLIHRLVRCQICRPEGS